MLLKYFNIEIKGKNVNEILINSYDHLIILNWIKGYESNLNIKSWEENFIYNYAHYLEGKVLFEKWLEIVKESWGLEVNKELKKALILASRAKEDLSQPLKYLPTKDKLLEQKKDIKEIKDWYKEKVFSFLLKKEKTFAIPKEEEVERLIQSTEQYIADITLKEKEKEAELLYNKLMGTNIQFMLTITVRHFVAMDFITQWQKYLFFLNASQKSYGEVYNRWEKANREYLEKQIGVIRPLYEMLRKS